MSHKQDYKDLVAEIASTGATWFRLLTPSEQSRLVAARLLAEPYSDAFCFLTQQSDAKNELILARIADVIRSRLPQPLLTHVALVCAIADQAREYFAPFIDEDLKEAAVADEYARGSSCEEC